MECPTIQGQLADFSSSKVLNFINNSLKIITIAYWDKYNKWPLNTYPIGHLKVAEVATTTTAITVTAGTILLVKLTCVLNYMWAIITVKAKPI